MISLLTIQPLLAQEKEKEKRVRKEYPPVNTFIGLSFGASFSVGDFGSTDINNINAGFASNGQKLDLYAGKYIKEKVALLGSFRYQQYQTEIDEVTDALRDENPGLEIEGNSGRWRVYGLLFGVAYKLSLGKRFAIYPRFGLGPIAATSPDLEVSATGGSINTLFARTTKTGAGLGYEVGIGFQTNLGKRLVLMPAVTYGGGWFTIHNITNTINDADLERDFQSRIQSINIGLSLAVRLFKKEG